MISPTTEAIGPGRLVLIAGPSGAGKDTLLDRAKAACNAEQSVIFARRVVTRRATEAEDHDSLDEAAFMRAVAAGDFALWWEAHGLKYGIPKGIDERLRAGCAVVCNVSRGIIPAARRRYGSVTAVLITAPADVLARRLLSRNRATDHSLADRLARNLDYTTTDYDHVIENIHDVAHGAEQLRAIIMSHAGSGVRS